MMVRIICNHGLCILFQSKYYILEMQNTSHRLPPGVIKRIPSSHESFTTSRFWTRIGPFSPFIRMPTTNMHLAEKEDNFVQIAKLSFSYMLGKTLLKKVDIMLPEAVASSQMPDHNSGTWMAALHCYLHQYTLWAMQKLVKISHV